MEDLLKGVVIMNQNNTCKGVYFRCSVNKYFIPKRGEFCEKITFRILRKISCNGCEKCGWIFDFPHEDLEYGNIFPRDEEPINGEIYTPHTYFIDTEEHDWALIRVRGKT